MLLSISKFLLENISKYVRVGLVLLAVSRYCRIQFQSDMTNNYQIDLYMHCGCAIYGSHFTFDYNACPILYHTVE